MPNYTVIDCRGHLMGRLASIVAKQLLEGKCIVAVRCEELNITGAFVRNKIKYLDFLRKRTNTNPTHGPFHYRAPSRIFWRTVRGMVPHKTARGAAAMARLKVFEGVPPPYDKQKRMVVPQALRLLRLNKGRKYTVLGRLSHEVGWRYQDVVARLEDKRKTRSSAFYEAKKKDIALKAKAVRFTCSHTLLPNQQPQHRGSRPHATRDDELWTPSSDAQTRLRIRLPIRNHIIGLSEYACRGPTGVVVASGIVVVVAVS